MTMNHTPTPSIRARVRSSQWYSRTDGGRHEDSLDRKARAEFESEMALLPARIQTALKLAKGE